jgi:DNA mismatch repair protein MutS
MSKKLATWVTRLSMLLSKSMIQEMMHEDKKKLTPEQILRYGGFIRHHYKAQNFELVDLYSKFDAYLSVAWACKKYDFSFPRSKK